MTLSIKPYKTLGALSLVFRASPFCAALYVLLFIVQTLMSTALMALATANFVDTAIAILKSGRPHFDIYMPLVLLLIVLGTSASVGSVISLVSARIRLNLQRKLKPAMVLIHAALDFKHIENAKSWELISRVARDPVTSIMSGFDALMSMMQIIVSISAVLVLIITQVWWAALIIIAFSTPMFWLSIRAGKRNYKAGRDAEKFNRRTEYLEEVLTGRENIDERTLFGYGSEISKRWKSQYEAGRRLQLKVNVRMFLITRGSSIILTLITILIALTLIEPVTTGLMTAGMFMGVVSAVFGMIQSLGRRMSNSLENISRVREYMKDLSMFITLGEAEGVLDPPDVQPIDITCLEFRNVRFKYPSGDRYILDGMSFTLESGRHYAFVGKNGAGKTTIIKLLTGLYSEYEGEILINGRELRQYPARALKALFSVVYQDFAKYYITLKDNILLGDVAGMETEQRANEISQLTGLSETISDLKDGMDTALGKIKVNGQDISGGQWQRVAIARSLISRAPLKMLDEPTAALDPISESRIYGEFEKLMRGKTTVFISHRLGSTKLADEILVVDGGRIVERGTHDELMETSGQYAEMFESQRSWYQ